MVLRKLLLLALASAAALCSVRSFVSLRHWNVRSLQHLVKVARRQAVLCKDADGRYRFETSEVGGAATSSLAAGVLTKDAGGRYRFETSEAGGAATSSLAAGVLTKDSQGRYRFRSSEASAPPATTETAASSATTETAASETAASSATSVEQSDTTVCQQTGSKKETGGINVPFIAGAALTTAVLLILVGNLLKGPSEEELAQKRREEAEAGSRTTFLFFLGGLAYIRGKPKNTPEQKSGITQVQRPKVVKMQEPKLVSAQEMQKKERKLDQSATSELGVMWSGRSFKNPERELDRGGFW